MLKNIFLFYKTKGSSTISVLATVVILVGTTAAGFLVTISRQNEVKNEHARQQIYYLAESAVSVAIVQINGVNKKLATEPVGGAGNIGSKDNPVSLLGGKCYVTTLAKQGSAKNIWIVSAAADTKNYTGNLQATFRSTLAPFPGCAAGLTGGDKGVELMSNAWVDSYDSSEANYNYIKKQGYDRTNGDVGSNGNITLNSNAKIYGNAQAAPGHTTTLKGNAIITGTTANLSEPLEFAPVKIPKALSDMDAVDYSKPYGNVLPSGDYRYSGVTLGSNLIIKAPARIYVDGDFIINTNNTLFIDNTNSGGVTIYVTGKFTMRSNTDVIHINNPRGWAEPGNFRIESSYQTKDFTDESDAALNLRSNTAYIGSAYAPEGTVLLNSNTAFFGAFAGRKVELDSNSHVHYDESLKIRTDPNDETGGALSLQKWDWSFKRK